MEGAKPERSERGRRAPGRAALAQLLARVYLSRSMARSVATAVLRSERAMRDLRPATPTIFILADRQALDEAFVRRRGGGFLRITGGFAPVIANCQHLGAMRSAVHHSPLSQDRGFTCHARGHYVCGLL
jgi:hypothetical protein